MLDSEDVNVLEAPRAITGGHGADACIDAVGMEAHGMSIDNLVDRAKAAMYMATDRPHVLREAILACRNGGTVSIRGVHGGFVDKLPFGAFVGKGLTMETGQTHVHRYLRPLLAHIEAGDTDPTFVISHRLPLDAAAEGYAIFKANQDEVTRIVLAP